MGSMNRGGLASSTFEFGDRLSGYTAQGLVDSGLDGGKMLLKIADDDVSTAAAIEACAMADNQLAQPGLVARIETVAAFRNEAGLARIDSDPMRTAQAIGVAPGLGTTSALTWCRVSISEDIEMSLEASTLPSVILGGDSDLTSPKVREQWLTALRHPTIRGVVAGRALLYPEVDDIRAAVCVNLDLLEQVKVDVVPELVGAVPIRPGRDG